MIKKQPQVLLDLDEYNQLIGNQIQSALNVQLIPNPYLKSLYCYTLRLGARNNDMDLGTITFSTREYQDTFFKLYNFTITRKDGAESI